MKKFQKKLNIILKIVIILFGVGLTIAHIINPEAFPKIWSYLVTIVLPFTPEIFAFFGLCTTTRLKIAFLLFLGLSLVMGIDFELYKNWYIFGTPCFDKIVHCISGVLAAFVAKEILENSYDGKNIKVSGKNTTVAHYDTRFTWLFIVSFVAFTAVAWECFEFFHDQITGGTMQELIVPGVADTMWDIVGALAFGIISAFPLSKK